MSITAKQAIESLQKIVEGNEDFVYQGTNEACFYYDFEDNQPSCGVGYALINLGVEPETFNGLSNTRKITALPDIDLEYNARLVLEIFQDNQDDKYTWGSSLAAAIEVYEKLIQAAV